MDSQTAFADEIQTTNGTYSAPTFEVVCLACEISSYAPDGDDSPLF